MGASGLLDEVRALLPQGLADGQTASRAIGYAQAIAVLGGRMSREEGVAETIRLTWRLVRRQRAWFARDGGAITVSGGLAEAARPGARRRAPRGGLTVTGGILGGDRRAVR